MKVHPVIYRWYPPGQSSRLVQAIREIRIDQGWGKPTVFGMLIVEIDRRLPGVGIVPFNELKRPKDEHL